MSAELALRRSIPEIVRGWEDAERDVRAAFALIKGAEAKLADVFGTGLRLQLREFDPFGDADEALGKTRRQAWLTLIDQLEIRRICSIKEWAELQQKIEHGKASEVPEITTELVAGMAKQFRDRIPDMVEGLVREVYDWLRPWREDGYKRNSPFRVGPRVIIKYGVDQHWKGGRWHVVYSTSQPLQGLDRVFAILDGKGSVAKSHYGSIEDVIRAIPEGHPCVGETEYFKFRGFQNKNLHVDFKRADLLLRFNQIAGGGMLAGVGEQDPWPTLRRKLEQARRDGLPVTEETADFFETPAVVGDQVVELAELTPGLLILEPTAGRGALVRALIRAQSCLVVEAWELLADNVTALCSRELARGIRNGGLNPVHGDILLQEPRPRFDRVVMNPPFSNWRDILHVTHAFDFLKPGGILVAVMAAGVRFRRDKLSTDFRAFVDAHQGEFIPLPDGSFEESGTGVRTVIVKIRRAT